MFLILYQEFESILLWCHMAVCSLYKKLCTLMWQGRSWWTLLWTYLMSAARAISANRDEHCNGMQFSIVQFKLFSPIRQTFMYVKVIAEREINKSRIKFRGPAGNRTQDLLNASQALLPLSHWCPWQRSGRYIIYRPQPNPADSLSLGGDPLRTG